MQTENFLRSIPIDLLKRSWYHGVVGVLPEKKITLLKKLYYEKKFSARKIAESFGVSLDAVYYFMRHHKLARRSLSEENRLRFLRKQPSFTLARTLSKRERQLKLIGVMLYWCEGYKTDKSSTVDFVNSDPSMVKIFMEFLRAVCGINENRLRAYLYYYSNQDVRELIKFWSAVTRIPPSQFTRPYMRERLHAAPEHKMPHGLVHVRYGDKKLLLQIMEWIEEYKRA